MEPEEAEREEAEREHDNREYEKHLRELKEVGCKLDEEDLAYLKNRERERWWEFPRLPMGIPNFPLDFPPRLEVHQRLLMGDPTDGK